MPLGGPDGKRAKNTEAYNRFQKTHSAQTMVTNKRLENIDTDRNSSYRVIKNKKAKIDGRRGSNGSNRTSADFNRTTDSAKGGLLVVRQVRRKRHH